MKQNELKNNQEEWEDRKPIIPEPIMMAITTILIFFVVMTIIAHIFNQVIW